MAELIENVYSKALFEISIESNTLDDTLKELISIEKIFNENEDLLKVLASPSLNVSEKITIIANIFEGKISKDVFNFLNVVVEKGRILSISKIVDRFIDSYNDYKGILAVSVTTTMPLSDVIREKLIAKLEKISGKKINLEENIDKEILGGIVLNYKNTQLDASLKTKLNSLHYQIDNIIA